MALAPRYWYDAGKKIRKAWNLMDPDLEARREAARELLEDIRQDVSPLVSYLKDQLPRLDFYSQEGYRIDDKDLLEFFSSYGLEIAAPFSEILSRQEIPLVSSFALRVLQHVIRSIAAEELVEQFLDHPNLDIRSTARSRIRKMQEAAKESIEKRARLESMSSEYYAKNMLSAASSGDTESVEFFIHKGVDINARDDTGYTALMLASREGHDKIVELLLRHGADTEIFTPDSGTALVIACSQDHTEIASKLLDHGADINARSGPRPPLHTAAIENRPIRVTWLLIHGADINIRDRFGDSALVTAAKCGHKDVVKLLIRKNASIGMKEMLAACKLGVDRETLELLLANGPEVNAEDEDGWTVLRTAVASRNYFLVEFLLENGADINLRNREGISPLMSAVVDGDDVMEHVLREKGASDSITDLLGACILGSSQTVKQFLDQGADSNARTQTLEATYLHYAAQAGNCDVAALLIEFGAMLDATDKYGDTAIIKAAQRGKSGMITLLLQKGAIVNIQNKRGLTALMEAARSPNYVAVNTLVRSGADASIRDASGMTALDWARLAKHRGIEQLLMTKM